MGNRGWFWLTGAKIACCGALLLVLTGVLSLATVGAFLRGNALPLAGGDILLGLFLARRWLPMRHAGRSRPTGARK